MRNNRSVWRITQKQYAVLIKKKLSESRRECEHRDQIRYHEARLLLSKSARDRAMETINYETNAELAFLSEQEKQIPQTHRRLVEKAISKGHKVPSYVLRDYPDLET